MMNFGKSLNGFTLLFDVYDEDACKLHNEEFKLKQDFLTKHLHRLKTCRAKAAPHNMLMTLEAPQGGLMRDVHPEWRTLDPDGRFNLYTRVFGAQIAETEQQLRDVVQLRSDRDEAIARSYGREKGYPQAAEEIIKYAESCGLLRWDYPRRELCYSHYLSLFDDYGRRVAKVRLSDHRARNKDFDVEAVADRATGKLDITPVLAHIYAATL